MQGRPASHSLHTHFPLTCGKAVALLCRAQQCGKSLVLATRVRVGCAQTTWIDLCKVTPSCSCGSKQTCSCIVQYERADYTGSALCASPGKDAVEVEA